MKKWTKHDVFLTISTTLFSTVLAYLSARFCAGRTGTGHYLGFLVLVPLVCTALLAWVLKKRGRRLRVFAGLLAGFDTLLLVGAFKLDVTTQIVYVLTGHYNAEAAAFALLIPLLCGLGMLIGLGLGALLARPGKRG